MCARSIKFLYLVYERNFCGGSTVHILLKKVSRLYGPWCACLHLGEVEERINLPLKIVRRRYLKLMNIGLWDDAS